MKKILPKTTRLAKAPPNKRRFDSSWDELWYLYYKMLYWDYRRQRPSRAKPFARRAHKLMARMKNVRASAFGQECLAIVSEVEGHWRVAVRHRKAQIRLIERIRHLAKTEHPLARKAILTKFTPETFADAYNLLSIDLWCAGALPEALQVLTLSRKLCHAHRLRFDGADLVRDISSELQRNRRTTTRPTSTRH